MSHRILVVDDEQSIRFIVKRILDKEGYLVDVACDGKEGWEKAKKGSYDLMLVDWNMPRMSGPALCRKFSEDIELKRIPIIMITVRDSEEDELEALHFGIDQYIKKPIRADSLLARIQVALRRRPSL